MVLPDWKTAIILIAFVVVASVFTFTVLSTGVISIERALVCSFELSSI
jgi:archaellin